LTTRDHNGDELALWDALLNETTVDVFSPPLGDGSEAGEERDEYVDPYERVADASLAFEQNWTPEREVAAIEETLRIVPEEARDELFERLLEIDATLSAKKGALLSEDEYCALFPNRVEAVKRVYAATLAEPSVAAALRVGRRVGPYKIEELVGVGGMGVVYKARDERFGRVVALKFLSTRGGDRREERVERFQREIWLMGQMPPGSAFALAYDCATDGASDYYIAMEYVDGVNLARLYRERVEAGGRRETGPFPWLDAAKLTREIADGLAEIHRLGFAHRDVKPENVMIDANGRTRVLDLGLALWTEERRSGARNDEAIDDGAVVGTPAYIAPEARRDPERVDQRSDLYSLGGVLLFLLTGTRPIDWFDPAATETPEPFEAFLERREVEIPAEVVAILTRLLEPEPRRRYRRAVDVVADLDAAIDKYAPERRRARRRKRARRCAVACAGLATLGAVLFYAFGLSDWRDFGKARRLAVAGEADDALAAATNVRPEALPTDKTRIEFFAFRGALRQNLARDDRAALEKALEDFEALLRLDAENVEALERAAELYAKLDEFEKARECVKSAAKLNPFDPRLLLLDGEISVLRGERERDVESFKDAVAVLTENLELGLSLAKTNDDVNNGGVWSAEIEAETLYWRARAYYRWRLQHRFFARGDLDDSLSLRADDVDALALRGDVLLKIARYDDDPEHAALAGDDYRRVAELTADPEKKERALNKAARAYERGERWDLCLDVCDDASSANRFSGWARLRRGRALFYKALARQENVDWNAIVDELKAGLPGATDEEIESEAFLAEIWALRVCCGLRLAASAKDDEKRAIQTEILEAVDEALKADEDVWEYAFGEEAFDLHDVGRAVAFELGDEKKADFYARRKDEREARSAERRSGLE